MLKENTFRILFFIFRDIWNSMNKNAKELRQVVKLTSFESLAFMLTCLIWGAVAETIR